MHLVDRESVDDAIERTLIVPATVTDNMTFFLKVCASAGQPVVDATEHMSPTEFGGGELSPQFRKPEKDAWSADVPLEVEGKSVYVLATIDPDQKPGYVTDATQKIANAAKESGAQ